MSQSQPPAAPRFFCPDLPSPDPAAPALCTLDPDQARHARKVLRLQPGSPLELFDGQGKLAHATLLDHQPPHARCTVHRLTRAQPPTPQLTIATAIPKGNRADDMVNHLSQLGVDRLIPLQTRRSVVDPRPAKRQRFQKHSLESAKQCGRLFLMHVDEPRAFHHVLHEPAEVRLFAAPHAQPDPAPAQSLPGASHALVLVGPEGGWTDDEHRQARDAGFAPWAFSPNVLRIETAALAAAAILRYLAAP